jgi:hypothetical protein
MDAALHRAGSSDRRLAFLAKFCHSVDKVPHSLNQKPPNRGGNVRTTLIPAVADEAPNSSTLTTYDEEHLLTYLRLLDAEADGAEWDEAALLVLHIDPVREPVRAHRAWESHLARATWLAEHGYGHLLYDGVPS